MAVEEQVEQGPESEAPAADIRLVRVTKRFDDVAAVDDVSLESRADFFALLGPSGCGETTSLRMISSFEEPTEGTIFLGDRDVTGLPAVPARHQHGLPELRASPSPLHRGQHRPSDSSGRA